MDKAFERLQAQNDTIRALVKALDLTVPGEGGHSERVSVYAVATGERMGMGPEELIHLRRGAALHDVGKLGLNRHLLHKIGELTEVEMDEIRLHAILAMRVIESLPWLEPALPMIVHHHERWDGRGYPDGLKGKEIPLGARIIAVAETYDVLTSPSCWKQWMQDFDALEEIRRCRGTQFDPEVVDAFEQIAPLVQPVLAADSG
ncbi:MAG: HD domain-containing phosphohydrolase [Fimbriimonadales bacterium]